MKAKKAIVESTQILAFDNHQVNAKGEGFTAVIQFTDPAEFSTIKKGDTVTIELGTKKK